MALVDGACALPPAAKVVKSDPVDDATADAVKKAAKAAGDTPAG